METILRVSHLGVELDNSTIFGNLSFELKTEETLVVLGPNGAGKTVLLKALLGLLPHRGAIDWKHGIKIGYVPQRVPLSKDLPITIEDFFGLKGVQFLTASTVLAQVGIKDGRFLKKQLGLLSSGQFQRVLIAWALVKNPDVLLFDEATAGVDVGGEEAIHDLLKTTQMERKLAVILVTHDLTTVYGEATHVLCMNGQKFCYGSPSEIMDPIILKRIYGREIKFFRHAHG